MEENWLNQLKVKLNQEIKAIEKKGVKVTTKQEPGRIQVIIDLKSLMKRMREEAKEELMKRFKLTPFQIHFRTVKGVELAVSEVTGQMTEEDKKKLELLQQQYPDMFQWTYKQGKLKVALVLNKFYEKGLEEIINKINQNLAEGIALMKASGVDTLDYKIEVGTNLVVTVFSTAQASNASSQ